MADTLVPCFDTDQKPGNKKSLCRKFPRRRSSIGKITWEFEGGSPAQ